MSFWYPRLNSVGDIIGGNGVVTLRSLDALDSDIGPGHSPQWITDAQVLVGGRPDGTVVVDRTGKVLAANLGSFNPRVGNTSGIDAGAGHWCGWSNAEGLIYDAVTIDPAAGPGAVDQATGALYYLTPYQANTKQIVIGGAAVRTAVATEMMAGEQAVAWGEYEAVRRLYGWSPEHGISNLSPLADTELLFQGVPVRTPQGLWLVTGTHAGLIVYPWGEVYGYVLPGVAQFHHARWIGSELVIVSTSNSGELQRWTVDLAAPRTDLRTYYPTTGVAPIPPEPEPKPPEPPEPEDDMKPPIVTVDNWTLDQVDDGKEFRFHDDGNPEQQISVRVWVEGGSMKAQITNKAGSATTGAARTVKPCSQVTPPDPPDIIPPEPPKPPTESKFTLKRHDVSKFLGVGPDKFLTQSTTPATFELLDLGDGTYGLKANGKFCAAESDHRVKADRDAVGEGKDSWEKWTPQKGEEVDTVSFKSWAGLLLSAHDDGTVAADQGACGGWESFVPGKATGGRPPLSGRITAAGGRVFHEANGAAWRWMGVSAFRACRDYTDGKDIQPYLDAFPKYNLLRVWDYVPWEGTGWESCSVAQWKAFLAHVGAQGWYVELTLLTDDNSARIPYAKELVQSLADQTNLLIEIGNEPKTNKSIDTQALRAACDASGLLYSSGNYEDNAQWFGTFGTAHTPRDDNWSRKAHDLMEHYGGGGPHYKTEPACKAPWVADEPIRPDQAQSNWCPKVQDFRAYGGACAVLGAGATFHFDGSKYGNLPTAEDTECAKALLEGLTAFAADAPNGPYSTIDEGGETDDDARGSRTYIVGNCMVRVRPTTTTCPQQGWTAIDADGILFKR